MHTTKPKAPTVAQVLGRNTPEKEFRAGAIKASIWANEIEKEGKFAVYKTVTFSRSYKDKQSGEWKTAQSLRPADLPKAMLVLQKAYEYLSLADTSSAIDEEEY